VSNARVVESLVPRWGSLDAYLWRFVDGAPIVGKWQSLADVPAITEVATAMSRELRRDGLRFVGPTTLYAFMQASGMVDDHTVDCIRFAGG